MSEFTEVFWGSWIIVGVCSTFHRLLKGDALPRLIGLHGQRLSNSRVITLVWMIGLIFGPLLPLAQIFLWLKKKIGGKDA